MFVDNSAGIANEAIRARIESLVQIIGLRLPGDGPVIAGQTTGVKLVDFVDGESVAVFTALQSQSWGLEHEWLWCRNNPSDAGGHMMTELGAISCVG